MQLLVGWEVLSGKAELTGSYFSSHGEKCVALDWYGNNGDKVSEQIECAFFSEVGLTGLADCGR